VGLIVNRIYFSDFDDMEKQTRNLLLTEPDSPLRDWIQAMVETIGDFVESERSIFYDQGSEDGYSTGYNDGYSDGQDA